MVEIFQHYIQPEATLGSTARWLTQRDIPGVRRKNWDSVAVSRILHNPVYVAADQDVYWHYAAQGVQIDQPPDAFTGTLACNLVGKRDRARGQYTPSDRQRLSLANHMGLMDSGLWLACQDKLAQNRQISRLCVGKHTWLSGLLKCGNCGHAIKISQSGGKFYLSCSARANLKSCNARITVDLRELERAVAEEITALLDQCPPEDVQDVESQQTLKQLESLDQRIDRLVQAVAAGSAITAQYLERELQRLDREKQQLLAARSRTKDKRVKARIRFDALPFPEKKLVARNLIQAVRLLDDRVEVLWKV